MKWCMVAAMTVALLFGSVALAQDDGFDLDALLGDADTATASVADATADVAVAEAPAEEAEAVADEFVSETPVAEVADEFAAPAEEPVAEADPFADQAAEPAVEAEEVAADDLDSSADLFADESAPLAEEELPADVVEAPAAAADDLLGDLFGEAPAAEPVAEPADDFAGFDEPAVAATDDFAAPDYGDDDDATMAEFTPAGTVVTPSRAKATKPAEKLDPKELKKLAKETAQQEELRRQAAEADALKASDAGFAALSKGEYAKAESALNSALINLPDRPQNAAVRDQIMKGLAEAQYLRAHALVQKKERPEEARRLVDSALKNDPAHRGALALSKKLDKIEAEIARPKLPAEQPATLQKQADIGKLYDEARQWYMLKDYDRAKAAFEQILKLDPYHKSAMRYLRKLEEDKFKLATYERHARVQEMMTDVRRSWSPPTRLEVAQLDQAGENAGVNTKPASQRLQEKMKEIIIPAVEFRQANINDVVSFLVDASVAADPEKEGVNIILNLGSGGGGAAPAAAAPAPAADEWGFGASDFDMAMPASSGAPGVRDVTLNLRRISMLDAIKYITEVAGLKYRVEDAAVIITSVDTPVGNIITRMYPVQPSFMDVVFERQSASDDRQSSEFVSMGDRSTATKSDIKEFFEKTGVKFPAGASVTYNATISQLIVANTADNLETFEQILQRLNVVPNQVEIEARFIEVNQDDLEELGLQWILNDNYEFATKNDGSGQRMQVNANKNGLTQGNRFFNYSIDTYLTSPASPITRAAEQTPLGGILSASSVLTNPEVTVVLQALSQHGGTDLLSAPRVTTRSGVNAQIQVVREIIYPTEFDLTQPTVDSDGNVTMAPIVTPGTFQTRETGVILNVTPTVGPDGYTIDLVMEPEVAELVDWIQYGSSITISGSDLYFFNMPMPVFTSRNVTTSIVIWDGQTVVMGGLIREEMTTIKDKVPILGDIPVLGWLFRSEGHYSQKKNLLIFVTARLVDPAGRPVHTESNMVMPGAGLDAGTASVE